MDSGCAVCLRHEIMSIMCDDDLADCGRLSPALKWMFATGFDPAIGVKVLNCRSYLPKCWKYNAIWIYMAICMKC